MQASDEVRVNAQLVPEGPGHYLLDHREREHVVGQALEGVVRPHAGGQLQPPVPDHELQGAGARDFLVRRGDVLRVEQLDHRPPGGRVPPEQVKDVLDLVIPPLVEETGAVGAINRRAILGLLPVLIQVVADELQVIALRQIPE